jgi:hypothetical protein
MKSRRFEWKPSTDPREQARIQQFANQQLGRKVNDALVICGYCCSTFGFMIDCPNCQATGIDPLPWTELLGQEKAHGYKGTPCDCFKCCPEVEQ